MFHSIHLQNFKSWQDTNRIELGPITGFFGGNSSGKSTILQFFLLLKQTIESSDRQRVLHLGDDRSYVDLGTIYDLVHRHSIDQPVKFSIQWQLPKTLEIPDPKDNKILFRFDRLTFSSAIILADDIIQAQKFTYDFINQKAKNEGSTITFGLERKTDKIQQHPEYKLISEGYTAKRTKGRVWPLSAPIKCYGFPDEATGYYQNTSFLSDFVLALEKRFQQTYYLGPLREYPKRIYTWAGDRPQDVGDRGELAIPALLASGKLPTLKQGRKTITIEQKVAQWLKDLGLIYDFKVKAIAKNRKDYEVKVKRTPNGSEVLITDVGFGVSQVLPVLVLCYYAPEGSTIILEQPEIHLHPSVQAGLADVFIDAMKTRNLQLIVESHSEHLLRRLQRRIAEEKDGVTPEDIRLYFCDIDNNQGRSQLTPLQLDLFGNIANWPPDFFGDEMGDIFAMTEAAMTRQQQAQGDLQS